MIPMASPTRIVETTQVELSRHLVAPTNIWDREFPAEDGGSQSRPSAVLSLMDTASGRQWEERVFVGSRVVLGADTYQIIEVEEGETSPGHIVVRRVEP